MDSRSTPAVSYPEEWGVNLADPGSTESQWFFIAEGRCEGRIFGRFRGANHPRRRSTERSSPTSRSDRGCDGATIYFDFGGYGQGLSGRSPADCPAMPGISATTNAIAGCSTMVSVSTGEVRVMEGQDTVLVLGTAELIWEPRPNGRSAADRRLALAGLFTAGT